MVGGCMNGKLPPNHRFIWLNGFLYTFRKKITTFKTIFFHVLHLMLKIGKDPQFAVLFQRRIRKSYNTACSRIKTSSHLIYVNSNIHSFDQLRQNEATYRQVMCALVLLSYPQTLNTWRHQVLLTRWKRSKGYWVFYLTPY